MQMVSPQAVDGGQHLRHGQSGLEFDGHGINHRRIQERLVALNVDDHSLGEVCRCRVSSQGN